jgi:hypothetical protein
MDGSKNGQAGAPTTATVTKGSGAIATVPATAPAGGANDDCYGEGASGTCDGLAGALTPAAKKGRPTGGWGHVAAVAPVAVPAGAPATTMAPTTRSREAAAAA